MVVIKEQFKNTPQSSPAFEPLVCQCTFVMAPYVFFIRLDKVLLKRAETKLYCNFFGGGADVTNQAFLL